MSKFAKNLTRDLMRAVAVSATTYRQQRKAQRQYNAMKAKMEKYIYTPADQMTTDEVIEDLQNWGYEVVLISSAYILRKNMMVMYRASNERELREFYANVFSVIKLC